MIPRAAFFCAIVSLAASLGATEATDPRLTVLQPGDDLPKAVLESEPGDRLELMPGRYAGGFDITHPLTIVGRSSPSGDKPVTLVGPGNGSVIRVDAEKVHIEGLHISGSGSSHETIDSGVQLTERASQARVIGNFLEGNLHGVDVHGAHDALVSNNTIIGRQDIRMNSRGNGVYVWNAPGTEVVANEVQYGRDGIFVNTSKGNSFRGNQFRELRFAVHYMYADDSEVINNYSEGNHLGYAIMFSTGVKVLNNVSVADRDYGMMLNYANSSVVSGNQVRRGPEKCLFMYNANKNLIENNQLQACQIGIHFTAGSERNTVSQNAFLSNRVQVKYVGSRFHDWSGNFWSDHVASDINGDGIADQAFRPNDRLDQILWTQPAAHLLLGSPALQLIRWAQREFPTLMPGGVTDTRPLMRPPASEAWSSPTS